MRLFVLNLHLTVVFMKKYIIILFLALGLVAGVVVVYGKCLNTETISDPTLLRLKEKVLKAKTYCAQKGLNLKYCFLVDFSIHSGKKRFFIWDFTGDSIKTSSLCAHGYGKNSTLTKPVYSNVEGSYCSSLGKYRVGIRSYSKWGINVHYKLHGLESTNDNAYKRYVVLHSYTPVPSVEAYPLHLPLGISQGCPVICDKTMRAVDALLKAEKKPLLLWIYE